MDWRWSGIEKAKKDSKKRDGEVQYLSGVNFVPGWMLEVSER